MSPCTYVSENVANIRNLKLLLKSLDIMGHTYKIIDAGNGAAVITSRDFRIEITANGCTVDRTDGNRKWTELLKQRYAIETQKEVARKKGYFVKEDKVGEDIRLSLRK